MTSMHEGWAVALMDEAFGKVEVTIRARKSIRMGYPILHGHGSGLEFTHGKRMADLGLQ